MKKQAVVTGDIINFTALTAGKRQQLIEETDTLLKSWIKDEADADIFRGDSYQLLLQDPTIAMQRCIQLICWFKMHSTDHTNIGTRISVGIGEVAYKGKTVLSSDGEAFHLSGRNFDKMKDGQLLTIHTGEPEHDETIKVILAFINKIIAQWTVAQAQVIFEILNNQTQQEIAKELGVSQPSINSRIKNANWKEIEMALTFIAKIANKEHGN